MRAGARARPVKKSNDPQITQMATDGCRARSGAAVWPRSGPAGSRLGPGHRAAPRAGRAGSLPAAVRRHAEFRTARRLREFRCGAAELRAPPRPAARTSSWRVAFVLAAGRCMVGARRAAGEPQAVGRNQERRRARLVLVRARLPQLPVRLVVRPCFTNQIAGRAAGALLKRLARTRLLVAFSA